jgi:hypothetical protein
MHRIILFDAPLSGELHDLLAGEGARPDSSGPLAWLTPSPEAFTAIETELNDRNVPFTVFYEIRPSPEDDPGQLAAGIGLRDFAELDATPEDLVLACDERTLATVVSRKMATFLEANTSKMVFDPLVGHDGFFVITSVAELPDPVAVPQAMFLSEGTDGTWAVQSDGRELLSATNLRVIQEHGVVAARYCVTAGKVLRWRRPLIFSGFILAQLRAENIQGLLSSPVFLGHATEQDVR